MSAAAEVASEPDRRLQVLGHCPALRTALRRALRTAGSPYRIIAGDAAVPAGDSALKPDAIVLDTGLAGSGSFELVRQIAASYPNVPIFVTIAAPADERAARRQGRESGASQVFIKPEEEHPGAFRAIAGEMAEALTRLTPSMAPAAPTSALRAPRPRGVPHTPRLLVVGSSTGGPQALINVFSALSPAKVRVPVLVVQHMPAAFTPILADHLARATEWRAMEAKDDDPLTPGEIRIAPGGHHLVIAGTKGDYRLRLNEDPPVNFCRPSADVLFVSAAQHFGRSVMSVILTGMGNDGCEGAKAIAAAGGIVYAQDEATSVVWGMPGAAVSAGVVDRIFPLPDIAPAVETAMMGVR